MFSGTRLARNFRPISRCLLNKAAPTFPRAYSTALKQLAELDASKLQITKTSSPKELIPPEQLVFGKTFTDHMLTVEWTAEDGWLAPKITPYQNLSLDPATCVFHYAFECFEGMKAYKDSEGQIRLFRPEKNAARFSLSSQRLAMPAVPTKPLITLLEKFLNIEERFIPTQKGYSLYLRPTMIGTQKTLGVGAPGSALLFVIASPVGPYYPTGFKAVSLEARSDIVRAWPGGVGDKKLGANYAPCIAPQLEAAQRGFQQNLWLFGPEGYVTEVGTMNVFFAWIRKDGKKEFITAPLDGTILEGITRDSVLGLAREKLEPEGWVVSERKFTIAEVKEAEAEGRLLEAFGSGTAAVVSPIKKIVWDGGLEVRNTQGEKGTVEINVPLSPGKEAGPVAQRMWDWMAERQYGDIDTEWSAIVPKEEL
ncbi:putative branched-chain-amino-acid transaminase [Peziza echinospora]|nr:putative branched-chain-amino-acid transaminase [Peziza echinospora]